MDRRMIAVIMELIATDSMSLYELTIRTGMEKEEVCHVLGQLDTYFEQHGFGRLIQEGTTYHFSEQLRNQSTDLFALLHHQALYLTQEERLYLLLLYTFIRKDFLSNLHYQELLNVSRNTALSDIKEAKKLCAQFSVELDYTRAEGYHLKGREENKCQLLLYVIGSCVPTLIGPWMVDYVLRLWQEESRFVQLQALGKRLCRFYQMTPLTLRLEEYLYFLQLLGVRRKRVSSLENTKALPVSPSVVEMAKELAVEAGWTLEGILGQIDYLAMLLQGCMEGEASDFPTFSQLTTAIVEEMETIGALRFSKKKELLAGLQRHLIPAYYRVALGCVPINSYTEVIKKDHAELFSLVKKALLPLEKVLGCPIPDSEVAYFTVHFGGYLDGQVEEKVVYRALVFCPNGISSSLIIKEQLQQLFPSICFSARNVERAEGYDMIFSTVPIVTSKPLFLVAPLLTELQKKDLFTLVCDRFPNLLKVPIEIEEILTLIQQHATIHHPSTLKYELAQLLNQMKNQRKEEHPMLEELITERTFSYSQEKLSWQEAIRQSALPLLETGVIEEAYIGAMVAKVEEFGPFIDLGKGVAIPHARPDEGVNQVGMSMLRLENPIHLADDSNHEVRLLICIAAVDNHTHLRALSHLTTLLRDENSVQQLLTATRFEDIYHLLKEEQ